MAFPQNKLQTTEHFKVHVAGMDATHQKEQSLLKSALCSLAGMNMIAGTVGGMACILASHPFDTIKVRLQTASSPTSIIETLLRMIRKEGARSLYRGMSSPLLGVAAVNGVSFAVYGWLLDIQLGLTGQRVATPSGSASTLWHVFWAAAGSGLVSSFITSPIELVKVRMQSTPNGLGSSWDCLRRILRVEGTRGCFRGLTCTILRDAPSSGVYFVVYEGIRRELVDPAAHRHWRISAQELAVLMFAGGVAGSVSWLSTYPADVLKTRIQASDGVRLSTLGCLRSVLGGERGGWRLLWRGVGAAVIPAFPTNAFFFVVYGWSMRALLYYAAAG